MSGDIFKDAMGRDYRIKGKTKVLKISVDGTIVSKRCPKCKEYLPIEEYTIRPSTGRYTTYCHECEYVRRRGNRATRFKFRKFRRVDGILHWKCAGCKRYKPEQAYHRRAGVIRSKCDRCMSKAYFLKRYNNLSRFRRRNGTNKGRRSMGQGGKEG